MGMTIEKAIDIMEHYGKYGVISQRDGRNKAIETMRKYQKIEQIVNSNPDYIHHTDMDTYKLNSIREVVENGKID